MKLIVRNGKVAPVSFFKFVFVGHAIGLTMVFLPMFLLVGIISVFVPAETTSGETVSFIFAPLLVPLIALMQGLMIGGTVTLGLWLYTRKKQIIIEEEK